MSADLHLPGRVFVGTSGWTYRHWRGEFYPAGLVQWREGGKPPGARRLTDLPRPQQPRDVYVYFDNDLGAHAPRDALALTSALGVTWPPKG